MAWLIAAAVAQAAGTGDAPAVPPTPVYEVVMDIDVDAQGIATACKVAKNAVPSIDPCESMPLGEPLMIPVGRPESMAGVVRVTTTAAFRRR